MSRDSIKTQSFQVQQDKPVHLKKWPTEVKPFYHSKKNYKNLLKEHIEQLTEAQNLHYASNRNALLLIFQGMDGAGKDGTIKHVMSGVNPQGCRVYSFKHPSADELEHDFLWRCTRDLPERGQIGIFNRSYYEEVLIARVHPKILEGESLANDVHKTKNKGKLWHERYQSILNLERHLELNGTKVIKFFLHLSYEEQRKRFLSRIDDVEKNWKLSVDDIKERAYWKKYQKAYSECLSTTSTEQAPWYVIPADDKLNARLIVSQILIDTFADFKMKLPKATPQRKKELAAIRKNLISSQKEPVHARS